MLDIQNQINARIDTFISDIAKLAQQAARESLPADFTGKRKAGDMTLRGFAPAGMPDATRRDGKRSPKEISETADALLAYIRQSPGQRMEGIARSMGYTTKELTLPLRKLIETGKVRTQGQKRATEYFPAARGPSVRIRRKGAQRRNRDAE